MGDLERHAHRGPADGDWLIHTHAGDLHRHTVRKETETGEFADIPYGYIEAVPDTRLEAAWREYRKREAEPWLREEVEALHDVIALLDGLVGAK